MQKLEQSFKQIKTARFRLKVNLNYTPPPLVFFQPLTEKDVRKVISKSATKLCDLEPCPTFIKECLDVLLTPITNIINLSLREGDSFKQAIVTPLLKKTTLDRDTSKTTAQCSTSTSCQRSLKRQWPLKLKPISGSLTLTTASCSEQDFSRHGKSGLYSSYAP